jgi:hypothetical protein
VKIEIAGARSVQTGLPEVRLDDSRPGRVDSRDFGRVFADEWEKCDNPGLMLRRICGRPVQSASSNIQNSLRPSDRKLRLWACSCVRAVWESVKDDRSRHAVEVAERYADGLAPWEEVKASWPGIGFSPAYACLWPDAAGVAEHVAAYSNRGTTNGWQDMPGYVAKADLMRDTFGNPFRPVWTPPKVGKKNTRGEIISVMPDWLDDLRTPQVLALARAAYEWRLEGGAFDHSRLMVLADALLDAGCMEEAILCSLRSHGQHYRGFWPLDLVLGKT